MKKLVIALSTWALVQPLMAQIVQYDWQGITTFNSGAQELNSQTASGTLELDDTAPLIYSTENSRYYSACKGASLDLGGVIFTRSNTSWDTAVTKDRLGFDDLGMFSTNYSGNSGNLFLYVNGDFQDQAIANASNLDTQTGIKSWALEVYDLGTHGFEQVQGIITTITKKFQVAYGSGDTASTPDLSYNPLGVASSDSCS